MNVNNMVKIPCINVLGMRVDMVQIPEVLSMMEEWIKNGARGNYIVISNANDAVLSRRDPNICRAVNDSSLSVPDGISLVMLGKIRGHKLKRRVYGPELMEEFCKLAAEKGYRIFFYGGAEGIPEKMRSKLLAKYPGLKVVGTYSPPFRELTEEDDRQITEMINRTKPDVLWIGLGCPKQQLWMNKYKDKIEVPVMVGVGAAFDFHAGTKSQAPKWMRENGMEWFFRLLTEPRRLWRRYIVDGAFFLYNVIFESMKGNKRFFNRED